MHFFKVFTISAFVLLFLSACDNKTFSKIYQQTPDALEIKSVELICIYPTVQNFVKKALSNEKIHLNTDSIYTLKIDYMDYKKACNNPMTSTYDATYDGFIRLTLLKESKRIYMCQKDFRGELSVSIIEDLLTLMRDDLEF